MNYIVDIAVDWITDKIYWTNINRIMVYDLQRGYKATVIESAEFSVSFHQVIVDPNARYSIIIYALYNRFGISCHDHGKYCYNQTTTIGHSIGVT